MFEGTVARKCRCFSQILKDRLRWIHFANLKRRLQFKRYPILLSLFESLMFAGHTFKKAVIDYEEAEEAAAMRST